MDSCCLHARGLNIRYSSVGRVPEQGAIAAMQPQQQSLSRLPSFIRLDEVPFPPMLPHHVLISPAILGPILCLSTAERTCVHSKPADPLPKPHHLIHLIDPFVTAQPGCVDAGCSITTCGHGAAEEVAAGPLLHETKGCERLVYRGLQHCIKRTWQC